MSQYYNPKKTRNIFDPSSKEPFKISRSKIELFLNCPKCFYFDLRFGISRPPGYPFTLNAAVDKLLKKEFDVHRAEKSSHPIMKEYGIDAVPYSNEKINEWRDTRKGISYLCQPANILFYGAVDDVWENPSGEIHIVDYKATSKTSEVTIDDDWQMGYKRQIEMYQWLFKQNSFNVSDIGYFVYCNGTASIPYSFIIGWEDFSAR
jgi:CRISPR/Cas system-associated exonuclease Cas4 (RecB family)